MFKDMKYSTLGKLVKTFKDSYEASWHTVIKVNLGLPFSYDSEDVSRLYWKLKKVNIEEILGNKPWADCEEIFDSYSRYEKPLRAQSPRYERKMLCTYLGFHISCPRQNVHARL